ncbi:Alpha/Beta hydrolase protein [Boletus reticuloceps]|uniref:Alpha/Beta hydrolase protein n=1 Tax=Boletus reticuloceps TaxID=495285 RepID=A0A8I2YX64_9AGAM|nr:Alpha/Beta hydrolase protein [Boletus reticuloceps]
MHGSIPSLLYIKVCFCPPSVLSVELPDFHLTASSLARDIIVYHIWGPRRRTWGIEMTVINSVMRDVSRHSSLADITMVRMVMGLTGLAPLPADALVTPVTFPVRKRNLRGILAALDAKETGTRELSGEWVVGKKLWQTLQSDYMSSHQSAHKNTTPEDALNGGSSPSRKRHSRVILYVHGAIDYRLAPETCFPGPLHDVVSAYLRLTEDLHVPAENVILAGDSAGGGLSLALLLYLRDNDYPLPGGAILFSPWVDLTLSCPSWDTNAPYDIVPHPGPTAHLHPVVMYLGDGLREYLTHPYASPLFGKFDGLPPLLIQCGEAEVLRDEIMLLAHKASLAGVHVQHEMYEDAIHVFQAFPFLCSSNEAFISCREFVCHRLPELQASMLKVLDNICEARLDDDIDNDNVRVVRGDGVETSSGRHDMEAQMNGNLSNEQSLPSWAPTSLPSTLASDTSAKGTESQLASSVAMSIQSHSGLRRIKSTLSVLAPDTTLPKMYEDTNTSDFKSNYSVVRPRMRKSSSHTSIASFVEQWTLSSKGCNIKQAQVAT